MKKKHPRRFSGKQSTKIRIKCKVDALPTNPLVDIEDLLETLSEVETQLTPTLRSSRIPATQALTLLANGIYTHLTGEGEISSHELRSTLIQFILLAWSQGIFTPGPDFPYSYEQVIDAFHPLFDGNPDQLAPPAQTSAEFSPYERLKEEMKDIDLARDELLQRGIRALHRKHYSRAEQYLREAVQADMLDESEACYFLALTRLWQRDFNEASYLFEVDSEDREGEAPLSFLLALWCALCASSSLAGFAQKVNFAQNVDILPKISKKYRLEVEGKRSHRLALEAFPTEPIDYTLQSHFLAHQ